MINVILAIHSKPYLEAVRDSLEENGDIRVVAEVSTHFELALRALDGDEEVHAAILESDNELEIRRMLTILFDEYTQIVVIVLARLEDRAVVYRQRLHQQVYEGVSLSTLVSQLRTADTDYWIGANE